MNYIDNDELLIEVINWKNRGQMSDRLVGMLKLLIYNYACKIYSNNVNEIEDIKQECFLRILKYGKNFDVTKTTNAFCYFSTIIQKSLLKEVLIIKSMKESIIYDSQDLIDGVILV